MTDTFALRLRLLESETELTTEELAEIAGVSLTTAARFESGEEVPDPGTAHLIARYFLTSDEFLLGTSTSRKPVLEDAADIRHVLVNGPLTPRDRKKLLDVIRRMRDEVDRELDVRH
jgi:transcriptional regulator with XRE-family HTH domain